MISARFLVLDCDSTLFDLEGIDEMARLRGPKLHQAVMELTAAVKNGDLSLDEAFVKRLDIIRPTRAMCSQIASLYTKHQAPGLAAMLTAVRAAGWTPVIASGGFRLAIEPLARKLSIGRIEAVELKFKTNGDYAGYTRNNPTARAGGKADVVRQLRRENIGCKIVMVGDSVLDLECQGVADLFIGFGGSVERPKVKAGAQAFIRHFDELPAVLAAQPA